MFSLITCVLCSLSGDNESGKTTLIAKLQGNEDPKKGSGLEYAYIDVRDEYRDGEYIHEHTHLKLDQNQQNSAPLVSCQKNLGTMAQV